MSDNIEKAKKDLWSAIQNRCSISRTEISKEDKKCYKCQLSKRAVVLLNLLSGSECKNPSDIDFDPKPDCSGVKDKEHIKAKINAQAMTKAKNSDKAQEQAYKISQQINLLADCSGEEKYVVPLPDKMLVAGSGKVVDTKQFKEKSLEQKLRHIINSESNENESNTPDWILAQFLLSSLKAFHSGINSRTNWYKNDLDAIQQQIADKDKEIEQLKAENEKVKKETFNEGFQEGESKQAILEIRGRDAFIATLKSKLCSKCKKINLSQ